MDILDDDTQAPGRRLRKAERREQILLELRLRPHVRIAEMAERFGVSTETVRRDVDRLSRDGLISRAHGGASAPAPGHYPGFDERSRTRLQERERVGRRAARLVRPGDTVMIDAGSTTLQLARALAYLGTRCTVITNSLPVAMALGGRDQVQVVLCPGDLLASESAVIGTDTVEFLERYRVDRAMIGASGLTAAGPFEAVRGFAAIKRAMLGCAAESHLLIHGEKFGRDGLVRVGRLGALTSVVVDRRPDDELADAVQHAGVDLLVARPSSANSADQTTKPREELT